MKPWLQPRKKPSKGQKRSCKRKFRYPTAEQAKLTARTLLLRLGRFMRAYQCNVCRQWHLTGHRAFDGLTS